MSELEHIPVPREAPKPGEKPSEKVGEDLPEGDFDIPMERASEHAGEDSSGFGLAQQFITAIRGEEKKQQQKEEHLAKILRDYIQRAEQDELLTTLLALLDRNVLASILVAALTIRDDSLREIVMKQLPAASTATHDDRTASGAAAGHATVDPAAASQAITKQFGASPFDPRVRVFIETWLFTLRELCAAYPKRLLRDLASENRDADRLFGRLLQLSLQDFFLQKSIPVETSQLTQFSEAIVTRLFDQMAEQIKNQKELR